MKTPRRNQHCLQIYTFRRQRTIISYSHGNNSSIDNNLTLKLTQSLQKLPDSITSNITTSQNPPTVTYAKHNIDQHLKCFSDNFNPPPLGYNYQIHRFKDFYWLLAPIKMRNIFFVTTLIDSTFQANT